METIMVAGDAIDLHPKFDDTLELVYGQAIHPEDLNELACNMAGLLEFEDVSVDLAHAVLQDNEVVELTPETARELAAEIILRAREQRKART